jgi:hypothetical protein
LAGTGVFFCFSGRSGGYLEKSREKAGNTGTGEREYNSIPGPQKDTQGLEMASCGKAEKYHICTENQCT